MSFNRHNSFTNKANKRKHSIKRAFVLVLLLGMVTGVVPAVFGCVDSGSDRALAADGSEGEDAAGSGSEGQLEFNSVSELEGREFAAYQGSITESLIPQYVNGAKPVIFKTSADCLAALKGGKVDSIFSSKPLAVIWANTDDDVGYIEEYVVPDDLGFAYQKGSKLKSEFDKVIVRYREEGVYKELEDIWLGADESKKVIDKTGLTGENGTIRLWAASTSPGMSYTDDNGELAGYEIDLAYRIARELGYKIEETAVEFDALLASLSSGKCDMIAGSLTITEERSKLVDFSETTYQGGLVAVVRREGAGKEDVGFFESVAESFKNTFIYEDRWKLILGGLGVTVLVSIASAVFGLILGFLMCMGRRSRLKVLSTIIAVLVRIIQGTPTIVLLMILYYIVFASSNISGVIIAIIGFSMNFAAYTSEMMRSGIEAVDSGQQEAALALGLTPVQSFFMVVFPQAAIHFIPVLKGEFISMVKMTSVVGYIAVEDLTKISDIIRSRTMEAFFPLISTAVIYFILANLLILIISFLEKRIDIKRRPRRVKL
ncbi:MAG: ABC transporter substrate-binding protein/permease [Eubacterium sp.]|nr:ABC transporter substrate-binding protein/permease [Eubacterium sp.]